ncbi:MAG: hypothetical protein L6V91_06690 [Bacilli bacterium]|nr:MAG: hypothetical protein L6V91_06690 [Bacilli bacterium]
MILSLILLDKSLTSGSEEDISLELLSGLSLLRLLLELLSSLLEALFEALF